MVHPANFKRMASAHYNELLNDAEMHRLRQTIKPSKDGVISSKQWVSISTMLKLRK